MRQRITSLPAFPIARMVHVMKVDVVIEMIIEDCDESCCTKTVRAAGAGFADPAPSL